MADTIPQIGSKGDRLDILIRQGGTFGPEFCTILKIDGSPEDITGCTFIAENRKTADATVVAASAVFAITNAAGYDIQPATKSFKNSCQLHFWMQAHHLRPPQ